MHGANMKPVHVSSRLAAHHQEDQLCINSSWYSHGFMLIIPVAVYTEVILLMMSSKPARNV
jgi:hypothetical protein